MSGIRFLYAEKRECWRRDSGARHASENRVYSVEFSFLTERDLSTLEKVGREDPLPDRGGKLAVTP